MDEEYQCSRKLRFRHYYLWLFLQVAFYHPPLLRVLEVHTYGIRGISIYSYYRAQNSYSLFKKPWFDTNVVFYYVYMSPLPIHVHIVAKGTYVTLFWSVLLSVLLNYKKLSWCLIDWHLSIPNVNGHAYSYPLPTLWR